MKIMGAWLLTLHPLQVVVDSIVFHISLPVSSLTSSVALENDNIAARHRYRNDRGFMLSDYQT